MRTRCLLLCFGLVGLVGLVGASCAGAAPESHGDGVGGTGTDANRGGSSGKGHAGSATSTDEGGRAASGAGEARGEGAGEASGASGAGEARGAGGSGAGGADPNTGSRDSRGGAAGRSESAKGGSSGGASRDGAAGSGAGADRGGATGAGGSDAGGGDQTLCNFASGLNVAWVNFARDVPDPDLATFNTIFKNTYAAGGRVIRWWFHTNGTMTPGYDSAGKAQKLPQSDIDDVKAILKTADSAGVAINISLWSFDMLQSNAGDAYTNNQALLEKDENRQAYIDNYLTPLVKALKGTPGLYAYEIFNEPEGMAEKGWATHKTQEKYIQRTVNWFAAAIHDADPSVPVTNGAQTFDYCSSVSGKMNYYSDSALRSAGGKQNGTLDFYEVHYYTANGVSNSPFKNKASYWGLSDKKLVLGEFAAQDTDGVAKNDTYSYLYTNGYHGAWAWAYESDFPWPSMQEPMLDLLNAHSDVGSCP